MTTIRLDLGGEKGNAFVILGIAKNLGRQLDMTEDAIRDLLDLMTRESWMALGGSSEDGYEHLVRTFSEAFPFVEIYADHDIGLPADVCKIISNPDVIEL